MKPTHTGVIALTVQRGRACTKLKMQCDLRATENFYVTRHGVKYRKTNGECVSDMGAHWKSQLLLDSVSHVQVDGRTARHSACQGIPKRRPGRPLGT